MQIKKRQVWFLRGMFTTWFMDHLMLDGDPSTYLAYYFVSACMTDVPVKITDKDIYTTMINAIEDMHDDSMIDVREYYNTCDQFRRVSGDFQGFVRRIIG